MTAACRFGWYSAGHISPYQPGLRPDEYLKSKNRIPAVLISGPSKEPILKVEMDGVRWFGRLMKRKPDADDGVILLYRS